VRLAVRQVQRLAYPLEVAARRTMPPGPAGGIVVSGLAGPRTRSDAVKYAELPTVARAPGWLGSQGRTMTPVAHVPHHPGRTMTIRPIALAAAFGLGAALLTGCSTAP